MEHEDSSEKIVEKQNRRDRSLEVSFTLRHSPFYQKAVQSGKRNNLTKKTGKILSPNHLQETSF